MLVGKQGQCKYPRPGSGWRKNLREKVRYAAAQHARADTDDCCFSVGSVTSLSAKKNIVGSIAACFLKNSHASLERRNFATDRDNLPPSQKRNPLRREELQIVRVGRNYVRPRSDKYPTAHG